MFLFASLFFVCFFFFKQKTAYEMRISDWSSDVCSSDLRCRTYALSHFLPSPQENCRDMLKLYYNPGSCSLASHAALEEAGLPYEAELIDLTQNAQFSDAYRQKNPWARVPALQIGDDVLTENIDILNHIAELVPEKDLLTKEDFARDRALEWHELRP